MSKIVIIFTQQIYVFGTGKGSFSKEPYKRNTILQKRPVILRSLSFKATPYPIWGCGLYTCRYGQAVT